jgi:hypothetical protein
MTSPAITRQARPGLRPQPLAGHGLVRVLGSKARTKGWITDGTAGGEKGQVV